MSAQQESGEKSRAEEGAKDATEAKGVPNPVSVDTVADFLFAMREKGIRIWLDRGRLRYQAPRGLLSQHEMSELRASADAIIMFLQHQTSSRSGQIPLARRPQGARIPLSTSQMGWYSGLQLEHRRSIRIGVATRLLGPTNIRALEKSIAELVRRHEALRTRIITVDGVQWQAVDEPADPHLELMDVTRVSDGEREATSAVERFEAESVDVAMGPLFAARLLKLAEDHHVLIISIDHLISDAISIGIIVRDMWSLYSQIDQGHPISLPDLSVQFSDYAIWQEKVRQSTRDRAHVYWGKHLAGARAVRLSLETPPVETGGARWGIEPIRVDSSLSASLREFSRWKQTTLAICALTAHVALRLRWSNVMDHLLFFGTAGRQQAELENLVGYFASGVLLRLTLFEEDSFLTLMRKIEYELGSANEHSEEPMTGVDSSAIAGAGGFYWIPKDFYIDPLDCTRKCDVYDLGNGVRTEPFPFKRTASPFDDLDFDMEPSIFLSDGRDSIEGYVLYRTNRSKSAVIERFARNLVHFLKIIESDPNTQVMSVTCIA